jgi:ubiquinone biosynthesis protein UbiJ
VDRLLEPFAALLNRGIRESASARGLCRELEGKRLALVLDPPGTRLVLAAIDGRLTAQADDDEHSDAELAGGALGFARLLMGDPQDVLRSGAVRITGATEVAERFQALLEMARPDPEEELARIIGDVAAHQVGRTARGAAAWASKATDSLGRSLSEYLREERRDLPNAIEVTEFANDVDEFAAAVDRAEARLRQLRDADPG